MSLSEGKTPDFSGPNGDKLSLLTAGLDENLPLPQDLQVLLERVDVRSIEKGGLIEAIVPLETIYREDVPVDASHVEEIARSIKAEADLRGGVRSTFAGLAGPRARFWTIFNY